MAAARQLQHASTDYHTAQSQLQELGAQATALADAEEELLAAQEVCGGLLL